jgi:monofunctional biosynthetic peptidoglycan transglycosylase
MAKTTRKTKAKSRKTSKKPMPGTTLIQKLRRWFWRLVFGVLAAVVGLTLIYAVVNPPTTPYMYSEGSRIGDVEYDFVRIEDVAPVMARSAVAAEDANFCLHWGLDVNAIKDRIERGGNGGASTISQQVVKNVYLWHGRSWVRKAAEALWTPLTELIWTKERILELYLNIAEFDEGVFGVQAASRHYFGVNASDLTAVQAARLAAILPSPKTRSASNPSNATRRRAASILDGAATIRVDGRAACFGGE